MDKKILFNDLLASIIEYAASKNNQLTKDEIHAHFGDVVTDKQQYGFIYEYLVSNKITVEGFEIKPTENTEEDSLSEEVSTTTEESEEELSFIQMYMEDMKAIAPAKKGEIWQLVSELKSGNTNVLNRLTELNLQKVATIAEQFRGRGVTYGDLIQEGNMGLMAVLSDISKNKDTINLESEDAFQSYIESSIRKAIEDAINTQVSADRVGRRLAGKLNQLDVATKNLSEKLGRVPEISELAEEMSISEEEVSWLLKTSLDTLSVNEDTKITEETSSSKNDISGEDPLEWRLPKN